MRRVAGGRRAAPDHLDMMAEQGVLEPAGADHPAVVEYD